ncbi:ABC transporter ATP-binding protein [Thermococcus sp. Bubb.Bath]|uniref:ABC transporter ATP-binding protein n=1 Tax=Thermococcus sp. Bubb.Bath TaxID=1638242 RepID=UPI0014396EAF|nr:ABC transporter ATP-binding protein [Thermococcus sp. Bubb.Bath]NJF24503.1 ABC transporter ATP-binding protein [Thermococcus sp. Bubb.Bath]
MGSVLKVENLRKSYGGKEVLRGVNLVLKRGETVCILGRNGAGKTTLLNSILGTTSCEGRIEVKVNKVGFLSQNPALYPRLTVWENLSLFSALMGVEMGSEISELVELLGMSGEVNKRVMDMSHGNAKKAELLCALVGDPELLIPDEPLVSLDYDSRNAVLKLLSRMKESGKTMLIVTHLPEVMCPLCDRTYELVDGRLRETTCENTLKENKNGG